MNNSCSPCKQGGHSQDDYMLKIQQIGFLLVDLNLYLDTHPDCAQAIDDYNALVCTMQELREAYIRQHGPLMNFGTAPSSVPWQWVDDSMPWPWENKRR